MRSSLVRTDRYPLIHVDIQNPGLPSVLNNKAKLRLLDAFEVFKLCTTVTTAFNVQQHQHFGSSFMSCAVSCMHAELLTLCCAVLKTRTSNSRNEILSNVNLWRDDSSADDQDIRPLQLPQFLDKLGDQGLVSSSECADANAVDVCVNSLLGDLQGRLFTRVEKQSKETTHYSRGLWASDSEQANIYRDFHNPDFAWIYNSSSLKNSNDYINTSTTKHRCIIKKNPKSNL